MIDFDDRIVESAFPVRFRGIRVFGEIPRFRGIRASGKLPRFRRVRGRIGKCNYLLNPSRRLVMNPRALPDIETDLDALKTALRSESVAVFDFETSDVRPHVADIAGLGAYLPDSHRAFYINVGHTVVDSCVPRYPQPLLAAAVRPFLTRTSHRAVFHNAVFDLRMLFRLGIDVRCKVSDTLILCHRLDENLRSDGREPTYHKHLARVTYGLKELTLVYFNCKPPTLHGTIGPRNTLSALPQEVARYCGLDVLNTYNLFARCQENLAKDPTLAKLIETIDDKNHLPLAKMMWQGVGIDVAEAGRQQQRYIAAIQACREQIWTSLGVDWGLDTPAELLRVLNRLDLRENLGYDPFFSLDTVDGDPKKTPSVTVDLLLELAADCRDLAKQRVLGLILSKWQMQQRLSAFVAPLPERVRYTQGRLYLDRFSSTLATTRFSCSPNLQNLPKRADAVDPDEAWRAALPADCVEHQKTRNLFVAKSGHTLVSIDLSAAEPRYLAMLFQRALTERNRSYYEDLDDLDSRRQALYPDLLRAMKAGRAPYQPPPCPACGRKLVGEKSEGRHRQRCWTCQTYPLEIAWPKYRADPLWKVFRHGKPFGDPYNALLAALDPDAYEEAGREGRVERWVEENRWRGKRAFLALAYGSKAETLAPGLKWSVERTQAAIRNLEATYATLAPLRELVLRRMLNLGFVRSLWGRPRRINGYYELAGTEPVEVQFRRSRPNPRTYRATIVPLGTTPQGIQAFVRHCVVLRDDGRGEVVLEGNTDGTVRHMAASDPLIRADHFNRPPFRNLVFSQIDWVRDAYGLMRYLPLQQRGVRQAFNALCQSTGADHLRHLMNRVEAALLRTKCNDCHLILTVHDSLIYEVPDDRVDPFLKIVLPIVRVRPSWSTIDIKVDVEVGKRFGDLKKRKLC